MLNQSSVTVRFCPHQIYIGLASIGRSQVELGLVIAESEFRARALNRNILTRGNNRHRNHDLLEPSTLRYLRTRLRLRQGKYGLAVQNEQVHPRGEKHVRSHFEAGIYVDRCD